MTFQTNAAIDSNTKSVVLKQSDITWNRLWLTVYIGLHCIHVSQNLKYGLGNTVILTLSEKNVSKIKML